MTSQIVYLSQPLYLNMEEIRLVAWLDELRKSERPVAPFCQRRMFRAPRRWQRVGLGIAEALVLVATIG